MATSNGIISSAMASPSGDQDTGFNNALKAWKTHEDQWWNAKPATSTASSATPIAPASSGAATYTPAQLGAPTQLQVAPNQTVQGQLKDLMDPNSGLIQQARTGALQQANSRGLLNSSIAQTGADEAAYAAAIPIATTDAATYNNAAGYNANEANVFAQQNANAANAAGQFNSGAQNTLTGQKISADTSKSNTASNNATQLQTTQMQTESAQKVAQIQQQAQAAFQGASNLTSLSNNYQSAITQIGSLNMDASAKRALQENLFAAYQQATKALDQKLGIPDTSSLLQFTPVEATPSAPIAPGADSKGNPIGTVYDANGNPVANNAGMQPLNIASTGDGG